MDSRHFYLCTFMLTHLVLTNSLAKLERLTPHLITAPTTLGLIFPFDRAAVAIFRAASGPPVASA